MRLISYAELRPGDLVVVLAKDKTSYDYYFVLEVVKDAHDLSSLLFLTTTTSNVQVKRISRESRNIFTTKGILLRGCN